MKYALTQVKKKKCEISRTIHDVQEKCKTTICKQTKMKEREKRIEIEIKKKKKK